jgi:hypothetical protein
MLTGTITSTKIRRPVTAWYLGRPASLYIEALAKRHTRPVGDR